MEHLQLAYQLACQELAEIQGQLFLTTAKLKLVNKYIKNLEEQNDGLNARIATLQQSVVHNGDADKVSEIEDIIAADIVPQENIVPN